MPDSDSRDTEVTDFGNSEATEPEESSEEMSTDVAETIHAIFALIMIGIVIVMMLCSEDGRVLLCWGVAGLFAVGLIIWLIKQGNDEESGSATHVRGRAQVDGAIELDIELISKRRETRKRVLSDARNRATNGNGSSLSKESHSHRPPSDGKLRLGALMAPESDASRHLALIGATGAGKTLLLRLLMQDAIPSIQTHQDQRALIYDPKQDMAQILAGLSCRVPIILSNPFDKRSAAWDMASDITEPRLALEIAFTLVPQQHESQPFFTDAARHLIYGVLLSYMHRELRWTFADVLRALASPKLLRRVLRACPHTTNIINRYFNDEKGLSNVLSTLATKILPFESIAAAWEKSTKQFSISNWAKENQVLVLGNSETSRHAIDAINRCIFKRASDLTLDLSESERRRSWFFLDELTEAGRLDGLVSLCKKGRSKGACVVMAFQSIAGLREKSAYGPELAAEIMGQIGNRVIGRLECPETAEWAAKVVGDEEVRQITINRTFGNESSKTYNESFVTRPTVLPSEFLTLPPCDRENGLTAWYLCRGRNGVIRAVIEGNALFDLDLLPKNDEVPAFIPRPGESQYLRRWSKEETKYFAPAPPKKKADYGADPSSRFDDLETL